MQTSLRIIPTIGKKESDILLNGLSQNGFGKNLVQEDTLFAKSGESTSRIDLVFTTIGKKDVSVAQNLIADHKPVLISLPIEGPTMKYSTSKLIANYKKINYKDLTNDLALISWENLSKMKTVDDMTEFFTSNVRN